MVGIQSGSPGGQARLKIVPPQEIPEAQPTPRDDLMALYKLSCRMKVLCTEKNGKGLSAVQVGIPWDLFIVANIPQYIRKSGDSWGVFVGCSYEPVGESLHESIEGCLSLRDSEERIRHYMVNRHSKVRIRGQRLLDTPGLALEDIDLILDLKHDAIVFQHEIDHAASVLISSIGKEILLWK